MKRLTYILAFVLVMLFPTIVYGATGARLVIDYEEVTGLDVPPVIMNNRVMVPARGVFERVGGSVEWDRALRQVTIRYNSDVLVMTVNETIAWKNGDVIVMDVPPVIYNNRTLIPLRFPAEALGFDVDWDRLGRVAIINSGGDYSGTNNPGNGNMNPGGSYSDSDTPDNTNSGTYIRDEPTHQPDGHTESPYLHDNPPGMVSDISSEPIQPEEHPITYITGLQTPRETRTMAYTITASSPISAVDHFLLPDYRLVLDIYNSRANISGPFFAYGPVSEVRSAQFSSSPYVTRIVFELAHPTEFSISLSYDRRVLTVTFAMNNISVVPISGAGSDTITIRGDFQPSVRLSAASYPQYLAIFVDNAYVGAVGEFFHGGAFVSRYDVTQHPDGVAVIRVFMHGDWPAINLNHEGGYVSVVLHQGLHGVRYNFRTHELRLSRAVIHHMDITQVQRNDEYLEGRYTLTLPVAAHGLGLGSMYLVGSYANNVTIRRNSAGYAQIIFDTTRIMAFTIHETHDEYIIRARMPQDVHPFIVVLDPGHGGRDPGAVGHGVRESDVVLAIAHMVAEGLSHHSNIQVYMTRHTDVFIPLSQRTRMANQVADVYVSIHANAVRNRPNVSGIETWYLPNSREDYMDFTSRQVARIIQDRMINATGAVDRGLRNTSSFAVLRDTRMPSVLLEVGFLTNAQEAAQLATTAHQQILAQAIYEGILEVLNLHSPR